MAIKFDKDAIVKRQGGLADILLSNPRGHQIKTYEFNGKPLKIMLMDPTITDNQWWKTEIAKYRGLAPSMIAEIAIRSCYHPLDYGQAEEEIAAGADPSRAGTPCFDITMFDAISNSTEKLFFDIADDWAERLIELYPFKQGEEPKN